MFSFVKKIFDVLSPKDVKDSSSNKKEYGYYREFREKYGESFDVILKYDELIAFSACSKNMPRYAVEWLADSIKRGNEIEHSAIYDSNEKKLPYLCETEMEVTYLTKEENPTRGSAEGIYSVLLYYFYTRKDENKLNYWRNRLIGLADNGDMMAQGMICWRCGYIIDGKYNGVLPQNIWSESKSRYESQLLAACESGNGYAQLAMAKFNNNIDDNTKEKLFLSAIEKRLTDACYYYAQFLNLKKYQENGMTVQIPTYGTPEWQEYMKKELSLYKMGAEFNNGVMAGYCQFRLADMYENGDGGVLKDASLAQCWYKKAFENGYSNAKIYIN